VSNVADVILFTDGACSGNPGPGGWAYILRHVPTKRERRASGADRRTTNNKMELTAVIEGLRALKRPSVVRVVTDSQYVSRGMTEWLPAWIRNNWRRGAGPGKPQVKNAELWQALVKACEPHTVTFEYVPGHAGHPENEECDRMAVAAIEQLRFEGK
jgi:ribonuclease HI